MSPLNIGDKVVIFMARSFYRVVEEREFKLTGALAI
jgi:hypothetical protein